MSRVTWALMVCAVIAAGFVYNDLGDIGGDSAQYILLARSLTTGQGYRSLSEPGASPHTYYPPVFPLLLTPIVALGGVNYWWMHLMVVGFGVLALGGWAVYLREHALPAAQIACVLVIVGLSPLWCSGLARILSDVPYAALLCGTLLASHRCARSSAPFGVWFWLTAVGAVTLMLTRTIGAVVVPSILCAWNCGRGIDHSPHRWRRCSGLLCVTGVFVGAWGWRNHLVGSASPSYLAQLLMQDPYDPSRGSVNAISFVHRLIANAGFYARSMAQSSSFVALWVPAVRWWVGLAMGVLLGAGCWSRWRTRGVAEWYVIWHMLVVLCWPEAYQDERFLLPLAPMVAWYLVQGWLVVAPLVRRRVAAAIGLIVAVLLLGGNALGAAWLVTAYQRGAYYGPYERAFIAAQRWLGEHTASDAVIVSRKPTVTALLTGRQAIVYPFSRDAERFREMLERYGVDYVVDDGFIGGRESYLVPAIRAHLDRFEEEMQVFGPCRVLTVRK